MLITEKVKEENRTTKWIQANGINFYELSESVMHAYIGRTYNYIVHTNFHCIENGMKYKNKGNKNKIATDTNYQ